VNATTVMMASASTKLIGIMARSKEDRRAGGIASIIASKAQKTRAA
jgi:hypothetical protein